MNQFTVLVRRCLLGIELYLSLAAALITAEAWWWTRVVYGSTETGTIRLQEIYGWLSIGLAVAALLMSLAVRRLPKRFRDGAVLLRESRWGIVAGGIWFGLLYAAVANIEQFGSTELFGLNAVYLLAVLLGTVGMVIAGIPIYLRLQGRGYSARTTVALGCGLFLLLAALSFSLTEHFTYSPASAVHSKDTHS